MLPYPVLETLFRHHQWANQRLLEVCATLSEEQLQARSVGGYGTIRETLQHIVRAERSYLSRISTGQPYRAPEEAPPLSVSEMAASLQQSGAGLIEWASRVQPTESVEIQWEETLFVQVPKAIILTQAINHATEHRTQVMSTLTQLGIEPPEIDSWSYFDEQVLPGRA